MIRGLVAIFTALILAFTVATSPVYAASKPMFVIQPSVSNSTIATTAGAAFISSSTLDRTGSIALKVAPKVADKLVKKYGPQLVKVIPAIGTTITVVEISLDIFNMVQQELADEGVQ